MLLGAQAASLKPGEVPRQRPRASPGRCRPTSCGASRRAVTQEIRPGASPALLTKTPPTDEEIKVSLRLPGAETVTGRARVVGSAGETFRGSTLFSGLGAAERDKLEFACSIPLLEHPNSQDARKVKAAPGPAPRNRLPRPTRVAIQVLVGSGGGLAPKSMSTSSCTVQTTGQPRGCGYLLRKKTGPVVDGGREVDADPWAAEKALLPVMMSAQKLIL